VSHVLLVEPYYGGSHRAWVDGWMATSRHQIGLISHAADFWRWRIRGGPVTLAEDAAQYVAGHGTPDAVVVSDMVDVAAFAGLSRRTLGTVPIGLYMHENQLMYPLGANQQPDESLSLANWRSMVAADAIWFNSAFQRDGLFAELPRFFNRQVDHPHTGFIPRIEARSSVLPVGVNTRRLIEAERPVRPAAHGPLVLWNQRWDHDKNPGAVFRALVKLAEDDVPFQLALAGENQRVDPREFGWVQEQLADRVVHVGHLPVAEYRQLLLRSDVVVSAAHHEFFGIAIVEAVAAGAVPVLPDRQSYPEVMPAKFHGAILYPDGELGQRLRTVLTGLAGAQAQVEGLREQMGIYDWSVVAPRYDAVIDTLVATTA